MAETTRAVRHDVRTPPARQPLYVLYCARGAIERSVLVVARLGGFTLPRQDDACELSWPWDCLNEYVSRELTCKTGTWDMRTEGLCSERDVPVTLTHHVVRRK
jgi:hypothetical protein